jgi:DegV family protein with EDD domain
LATVQIITDSTANFGDDRFAKHHHISVVPLTIQLGDQTYRDVDDIGAEEMFQRMRHSYPYPQVFAPSAAAFQTAYQEASRKSPQICVITHSQHLSETYTNALEARSSLLGRYQIVVIDSQTTSACLGYLVQAVAEAAESGADIEEAVRIARGIIPRLYSVFYVGSLDYIQRAGLLGETQAILGTMLNIKPLLTIEDGQLITMEKARTHSQAIDKMLEFVTEFTNIEKMSILENRSRTTERTRMLQDRLTLEFLHIQTPVVLYEPLLASLIGPDAIGMAVLEGDRDTGDPTWAAPL